MPATAFAVPLSVYRELRRSQVTFLAAAIAYYGFVSIIPLALLGLALGQFFGSGLTDPVLGEAAQFLSPAALAVVQRSIGDGAGSGGATLVGMGVLAWSASKGIRGLDVAFSQVEGGAGPKPFGAKLRDAALVLVAIPAALVASALLGVLLPLFEWVPFASLLGRGSLPVVLSVAFLPIYYQFPRREMSVRAALPGTVVAAVGWALLATGFSVYTAVAGNFQLYGVLGAALLLVTWLYLGGIIIMVGAVVNVVLDGGPREPDRSAESADSDRTEPAPDVGELAAEVRALRSDLDEKTMRRSDLESELKAYVRKKQRQGKATGWGPYLVLLYGTAMTLGAFYWLQGGWAILAMIVVWLSTLGLYVQLVIFGMGIQAASVPGRLMDVLRNVRS